MATPHTQTVSALTPDAPRIPTLRIWLSSFILFSVLSGLWALASPIFSVPDENAHAVKAIGQLQGQVFGRTVEGVRHLVVDLAPEDQYTQDLLCYATHPEVPAACDAELGDPGGQLWFNTWVGTYNPLYYYIVGWPTVFLDGNAGVYAMRLVSALVGSAFLASAFVFAVVGRRSRWMPLGVAFAAVPMNLYLMGSVNPNGLEIAGSVALWVGVLRLFETFDREHADASTLRRAPLWALVTVSAIVVANVRALGPLWVVVIVALAAITAGWKPVHRLFTTRANWGWLAAIAAGAVFSIAWTLGGGSLSGQAQSGDAPLVGASLLRGAAYMVRTTPDFLQQAAGWFGWFDTVLPTWAYWPLVAAVAVPLTLALSALRRRATMVMAVVLAAAFLVPVVVQARSVAQTGIIWQGRYGLFLYLGVLIVAAWLLSGHDGRRIAHLSVRITAIAATLVAAFGLYAFWFSLVRYVVGMEKPLSAMWRDPQWQPPLGWPALTLVFTAASAAYVVFVVWLARGAARRDTDPQPEQLAPEAERVDARD